MRTLFIALCLPLLLAACSAFSTALPDNDVAQYIKAYNNIADASPELATLKSQNNAISLLTCGPCLARIETAVQEAGYKDMKTFVAIDIRMHITLRAWVYAEIGKQAGEVGQTVAAEDFCSIKENIARSKDPKEMRQNCERLKSYSGYLAKAGKIAVKLAEKLLQKGDIEVIGKHAEAIGATLTNEKLPLEYRHGRGGGFDD